MKERIYTCPMSIHVTAADLAEIDAAAAVTRQSRNSFIKTTVRREIERLKLANERDVEVER